jgi:hypothetical protein
MGNPKCFYFGQWSSCPDENLSRCDHSTECYHAEESYFDHIAELIERDRPGDIEEYKKENYEGDDDQF